MPDHTSSIKDMLLKQRQQQNIQDENLRPLDKLRKQRIERVAQQNAPKYKQKGVDTSIASTGGSPEALSLEMERRSVEKEAPDMMRSVGQSEGMYDQQGNDLNQKTTMADNFLSNTETSAMRGLGNLIKGTGDMAQIIGAWVGSAHPDWDFDQLMMDSNSVADYLQRYGGEISDENQTYLTEELQNPTFSFKTFLNPEFWSTYGGEFLPQLAEIVASYGAGAIAEKAGGAALRKIAGSAIESAGKKTVTELAESVAENFAKREASEIVKETAENTAKREASKTLGQKIFGTVRGVTDEGFEAGKRSAGITNTFDKGSGLLGATIDSKGKLTKGFSELLRSTGAGMYTNVSVGLRNAGELYNTYKGMNKTDENGKEIVGPDGKPVPMFTKEELGDMAKTAFMTNLAYSGVDILNWSLIYGKGSGFVKNALGKAVPGAMEKTSAELVSKAVIPLWKRVGNLGAKMATEGFEESIQETYEEWSKMKGYHDAHGSLDGYQGIKGKYDMESGWGPFSMGFYDYWRSKDSESIRVISAAMGAMAGGAFNFREAMNKHADNAYKLEDRIKSIQEYTNTPEGNDAIRKAAYRQMGELIMENKGEMFAQYAADLYNNNKLSEEDFVRLDQTYRQISGNYDKIKDLKMKGQKAFMTNVADEVRFKNDMDEANERYSNSLQALRDSFEVYADKDKDGNISESDLKAFEKQKSKLDEDHLKVIRPLANLIANSKKNQKNLLLGKEVKPVNYKVKFDQDPNTGEFINPVYEEFTEENSLSKKESEEIQQSITEMFTPENGGFFSKVKEGAQKLVNKGKQLLSKFGDDKNNSSDVEGKVKSPEGDILDSDIAKKTEGAIDALSDSFNSVEDIDNEILKNDNEIASLQSLDSEEQRKAELKDLYDSYSTGSGVVALDDMGKLDEKEINDRYDQKNNSSLEDISDDEYNDFVNNGNVSQERVNDLANKISNQEELSEKEFALISDKKTMSKINETTSLKSDPEKRRKRISELTQRNDDLKKAKDKKINTETDTESESKIKNDTELTEEEKQDALDLLNRKEGKKSLSDKNTSENTQENEDEKLDIKSLDDDELFGNAMFEDENTEQHENRVSNKERILKTAKDILSQSSAKLRKSKGAAVDYFMSDFGTADFAQLSESIETQNALNKIFPDQNIHVYTTQNMEKTVGVKALGYALAGQIYIDETKWNQNDILMHEASHIYFDLTKDLPETQAFLKQAMKNKPLVDNVLRKYQGLIQYKAKNGDIFFMKDIISDINSVSPEQREAIMKQFIADGKYSIVPLNEQEVITDEVFAATLQSSLSEKYSKFFTENPTIKVQEPRRQFLAKKWWRKVKEKGDGFDDNSERSQFLRTLSREGQTTWKQKQDYFNSLSEDEQADFSDSMNSILSNFQKQITGKDVSAAGRAMLEDRLNNKISKDLDKINAEIDKQQNDIVNKETLVQKMKSDNPLDVIDDIDFSRYFDNEERFSYTDKFSNIITDFTRKLNKSISYLNNLNNGKTNWKNNPYVYGRDLRYQLSSVSDVSNSGADFIRRLRESDFYEVQEFMRYLDKQKRGDENVMLQMFHWHEQNTSSISSFKNYINPQGNSQVELNLNNREKTQMDNQIENIKTPFINSERKANKNVQDEFNNLTTSITNIKKGDYTRNDINNIIRYLAKEENGFDTASLIAANRVNINGKVMPLDQVIVSLAKTETGNGFTGSVIENKFYKNVGYGIYKQDPSGKSIIKPALRNLVQSLVNENRKYTSNYTINHADGTMHQARIVDNYLTRNFKFLKDDVANTSRSEFIAKHSTKNTEGKGMLSNKLAGFIYDKIASGGDIDLLEFGGIESAYNNDKTAVLKNSDPITERLSQFVTFLNSDKGGSYLMDLGRFSDSSRAYYTEVPKTNIDDIVKIGEKGPAFTNKAFLDNVYNTHKALGYDGTFDEFKNELLNSISDQVAFMNDNLSSFLNDTKFQKLIDPKTGKLSKDGQMKVAEYELNQIMNGTNFTEIFFPSFKMKKGSGENELVKRAKSASSPMFSFPNMKVEPIYLEDIKVNPLDNFEATDSGFYILEDDAERFNRAGGNLMPLGNAFKLLHTGIERNAPGLKGHNIYNKGFATILNEEVVLKNPELRGAFELLKARKAKYEEKFGTPSMNLLDGSSAYVPMIVPISSNKASNNIPSWYDSSSNNEHSALMNFSSITAAFESNPEEFKRGLGMLDKMYYDNSDNFIGADGSNFGIQQVMDIDKDSTNTSVQFVKSITSNMQLNDNQDFANDILSNITDALNKQLSKGFETIIDGTDSEIRSFIKEMIDPNLIDQSQRYLLFNDNVSLQTPAVKEIVKNTIANYIKQNGLKLKTPGNVLREKPSLFEKEYFTSTDLESESGSNSLGFYSKNSDGTVSKGEAVIPESMLTKQNPLKTRQYFVNENGGDMESLLAKAKGEAKMRGTSVGKVFNRSGNHIGYYAAGDTILATRIPSHGIQSTGVFEIVSTTGEAGNNIQLPNEFKKIIGSDNDGDQIFVQHKGKRTGDWNRILDKIENHYLSPNMWDELHLEIDFKEDAGKALNAVEKTYGSKEQKFVLPFSSQGRQKAFEDTLIAKANVGLAANLHTTLGMFRNYGIEFKTPITIDGEYSDTFSDLPGKSVSINSAKIFNIILDNSKNAFANKLGIDTNTIPIAMVLTNMGYDLDKVAVVLNHPVIKRYSELKNNNISVFNRDEKYNVMKKLKDEFGIKQKAFKEIDINLGNIENENDQIFNLINTVNAMNNQISDIGAVLSIHNTMTVNPFEINNVLDKFNNAVNPDENSQLKINQEFRNSPIVQNYKNVLIKNQDVQKNIDPVYSGSTQNVYSDIVDSSTKEMSNENHKTLYNALQMFQTAQSAGMNNISRSYYENLINKDSDTNIFNKINDYIRTLKSEYSNFERKNPNNSVTKFDNSILFTKALNMSLNSRSNKYISRNSDFYDNMIDDSLRNEITKEFAALPESLKNDLMAYDLMKNGWSGPNSLFPLFDISDKMNISVQSKEGNIDNNLLSSLKNKIIFNNPQLFSNYDNVFNFSGNSRKINPNLSTENAGLLNAFRKGDPFLFRTKNNAGQEIIQKFSGFSENEMGALSYERQNLSETDFYKGVLIPKIESKISVSYPVKYNSNPNLDYITIKSKDVSGPDSRISSEINQRSSAPIERNINTDSGRAMMNDWYNYDYTMDRETFDKVMEYDQNFTEDRKENIYQSYANQKAEADKLKSIINADTVKDLSNEELLRIYGSRNDIGAKYGHGNGFGNRNKFAYAEIMRPIVSELATRAATDQTMITGREYDGNDISVLKKYFMAGNVPSNHPAVQNLVRRMETEYKTFLDERSKVVSKINNATNALYKEQLGYEPYGGKGLGKVKNFINNINTNLFGDKEAIYKKLYGPLMIIENNQEGNYSDVRYKPKDQIERDYKNGIVSKAQYDFYNVTRETTNNLAEFALPEGKSGRKDYIPHVAPANWEILSRRGLLGLMVNAKTVDEKINDVKMDVVNPLTGELIKGVNFKTVTDWYNTLSASPNNSNKNAIDYIKLKKKAIVLNKKGINEDGTAIHQSPIEMGSAIGDVFLDRFANSRSVKSSDFPSLDLNKAFVDYTHAVLFQHGNEKFQGFKNMVPVIDGILAQADANGDKNISDYVNKIWKQYFIGGQKQSSIPNIPILEAAGITSDKVVDYITKGSLMYWLGWKGLAMGAGIYSIGNILVGKFNNVVESGGTDWLKGEKRFWMGKSGKFDITDPFKGIREANQILKTAGFMDINIYDDVNMDNKNSVEKNLMNIALFPMTWSERWIQGVHFLGKLSDNEWETLKSGKPIDAQQLAMYENDIREMHGKGYQPTDQRMIQMYSWGRAMMQFNRYIPTMFSTLFGKKDVDIYGRTTVGTYTQLWETIQNGYRGNWSPKKFSEYYNKLDAVEKKKLNSALISAGLVSTLAAVNTFGNSTAIGKLITDSHIILDADRLSGKLTPKPIAALNDMF